MQTLRKKTSPCKYKNEPSRFLGDGVSFKAKLIGILEVGEARGDRMCQEALADLKMAIRAAGEHKQRITINIAIDGLRLRDEKTGDSLYHHPVHKISFIAQDMSDSRAFGYIFGSPDTGHRFFGIKTDKAASQVVIAMRDLFQVVFELKKKEIELAKQHIEQKSRFAPTSLFVDTNASKSGHGESKCSQDTSNGRTNAAKEAQPKGYQNGECNSSGKVLCKSQPSGASAIADLVDLELELSSIQQGIHQMERITPSDPFGPAKDDPFNADPFGDSFISFPQKPFLPPPPSSGRERQNRINSDTSSGLFSPKTPKTGDSVATSEANLFKVSQDDTASCDWFTPTGSDSLFDDTPAPQEEPCTNTSILDVFTELDPLGTGRSKPYVDKKLFFQELKNPPKKVLKDLVTTQPNDQTLFSATFDNSTGPVDPFAESDPFDKADPFSEDDFTKTCDPFDTDFIEDFKLFNKLEQKQAQNKTDLNDTLKNVNLFTTQEKLQPLFPSSLSKSPNKSSVFEKQMSLQTNHVSPRISSSVSKQNTFDLKLEERKFSKSQLHENPSLDMSSESECAPEPPPRPASNISQIKPPPLPPKKQAGELTKPPPRPPHTDEPHYDYMDSYETGADGAGPPLPVPARNFATAPQRPKKHTPGASDEDYLTPVPPPLLPPQKKDTSQVRHYKSTDGILLPPPMKRDTKRSERNVNTQNVASLIDTKPRLSTSPSEDKLNLTTDTLDITLSQLTLSGLNELATKLKIPPSQLSNMTLVQLTSYLSNYVKGNQTESVPNESDATIPTFQADFTANFNEPNTGEPYDRYAVFRELLQQEEAINKQTETQVPEEEEEEEEEDESHTVDTSAVSHDQIIPSSADRYAALRDIVLEDNEIEQKESNLEVIAEEQNKLEEDEQKDQNDLNVESFQNESESKDKLNDVENNIIEYECSQKQDVEEKLNIETTVSMKTDTNTITLAAAAETTEIMQTNNQMTSGSLSDAITGSSPEMDNAENCATVQKKNVENSVTGESWAIFDTGKGKRAQSEEGASPWSSDSKEFGVGGEHTRDSESEGDWEESRSPSNTWWDSQCAGPYVRERPSTDSYEEEWHDAEQRRVRRGPRRQAGWGGQSSSSRDVSPWEEEASDAVWQCNRVPRTTWDRLPTRDSWDEDEDYEYEEEYLSKYQYQERLRAGREPDRDEWERRHGRRKCGVHEDRRYDKPVFVNKDKRYGSRYPSNPEGKWRSDRCRYYQREHSQESPWEDESPRYPSAARRSWKRPSSASETGELKPRPPYTGSDGERDRRYKSNRRSRSRDSHFPDMSHARHKADPALTLRHPHRNRNFTQEVLAKAKIDAKLDCSSIKKSTMGGRKKGKDSLPSPKTETEQVTNKTNRKQHLKFENDFVNSETDSPVSMKAKFNFENDFETSEAESPTVGRHGKYARAHTMLESEHNVKRNTRHCHDRDETLKTLKTSRSPRPHATLKQKSMFEDDFSPTDKSDGQCNDENGITVIPEELGTTEQRVSFTENNLDRVPSGELRKQKHILSKARMASNIRGDNIKKSESVNIFVRENDPFDDDFFSGRESSHMQKVDSKTHTSLAMEYKWTEDFDSFDIPEEINK